MEKNKAYLIAAPIVVSLICVVLAVNLVTANSRLNAERAKVAELNTQIVNFVPQLSGLQARYDEQVRIVRDLQNSLDAARREAQILRAANSDLEARLNAASAALQASSGTTESAPETPAPAAE